MSMYNSHSRCIETTLVTTKDSIENEGIATFRDFAYPKDSIEGTLNTKMNYLKKSNSKRSGIKYY